MGGGGTVASVVWGWVGTSDPSMRFFWVQPEAKAPASKATNKSVENFMNYPRKLEQQKVL
jgi:hypothetical protein